MKMISLRVCFLRVLLALSACCCAHFASGQLTPQDEVNALLEIRHQLIDPLNYLANWDKGDPCTTNWTGVICYFYQDDGYLHVQELRLMKKNLSGYLSPELGKLSRLTFLNFMWNRINGIIPKAIGNLTNLKLLLLSGNQLSGPLPDELGYLPNATKFQLDLNNISGPLPNSFANLPNIQHFHMNNNSISGQIPPELYKLPKLIHFLLDNNKLTGYLPPELSMMPKLTIFQLDNNNFEGNEIPSSYANMSKLLKLSLRNCNLTGAVPDFSNIPGLLYVDLSQNNLSGSIPTRKPALNITTIDLSNNLLSGTIPSSFSGLSHLQKLSLHDNYLTGEVPTDIWQNMTLDAAAELILDFRNNALGNITGSLNPPPNVTVMLEGNPVCRRENELNIVQYCGNQTDDTKDPGKPNSTNTTCLSQSCPYQYVPDAPVPCYCAAPIGVGLRLRSPSISDFPPYISDFKYWLTTGLHLDSYQLAIDSYQWERGPRLRFFLNIFPQYMDHTHLFNKTGLEDIQDEFAKFTISTNDFFGPYDLLNFTLVGPYAGANSKGMKKGVLVGIVLGSIFAAAAIVLAVVFALYRRQHRKPDQNPRKQTTPKIPMKVEGIKAFTLEELEKATNYFEITSQIGQGGYGKVYRGVLASGMAVAIKRAQEGSLQGQKEFFTEIELLSRVHHRNLVSLIGYCDEQNEQMLVYEFMPNGSLYNLLSGRYSSSLSFAVRLRIALGSAKGIIYLHTEADPPIIHRDIKANNILLDSKFNPKVSDFGISRLFSEADCDDDVTAHISTNVKGTPGYVDPEYFLTHKLTEKSDVYSLGIVFLELLTGMQPISHGRNIVREVLRACQGGQMFSIIDRTMGPYPSEPVKKFMALALKCCEEEAQARPTMLEVVRTLESMTATLPQADAILVSDSNNSYSGNSDSDSTSLYGRNSYVSSNIQGSDLVSGVIPTIRPR